MGGSYDGGGGDGSHHRWFESPQRRIYGDRYGDEDGDVSAGQFVDRKARAQVPLRRRPLSPCGQLMGDGCAFKGSLVLARNGRGVLEDSDKTSKARVTSQGGANPYKSSARMCSLPVQQHHVQ